MISLGIIAGGEAALRKPIEGAEDVITDGIKAIDEKNVNENDIVIGTLRHKINCF